MKILFIHPNMPGQFKHLCRIFGEDPDNTVVFITKPRPQITIPGVHKVEYKPPREPSPETHRYITSFERAVLMGQEVWRMCKKLKTEEGFTPDVIVAHPGWGDTLLIKDIYPGVPLLNFFEFYYHGQGADVNFDPEDVSSEDDMARIRIKNTTNLFALEQADWGLSPTFWQWQQNPKIFLDKISVLHDGIDTNYCKPAKGVTMTLGSGAVLRQEDEVITYVARNFEPYRGFTTFMHAAEIILKERPNARIVAVGGDEVSYGKNPPPGTTYRQLMMKEVDLDLSRIHFVGRIPYGQLIQLFQITSAHLYLTYPFVLSWSFLESMACEAPIIASATKPVEEVIRDKENGLLVDFFSPEEVAKQVSYALENRGKMKRMRKAARKTVEKYYALKDVLPLHQGLVTDLAKGEVPPPTAEKITERNQLLWKRLQSEKAHDD